MKNMTLIFLMLITLYLSAFEINNYETTFIDSSRDDREINTRIYYPVSESKGSGREETFPKFIFGHGWLTSPASYSQLAEYYAGEGFIVALPATEGGLLPNHSEFALDLIFLASALDSEGQIESSPLYQQVASEAIVSGHSMGGGASILAASQTNLFSAVVNFAAAETSPSAINNATNIVIPVLLFSGSSDNITPPSSNQVPMYENLASDYKSIVTINGQGHLGITTNNITYTLAIPFINYVLTGEDSYRTDFENLLANYQLDNQIEYLLTTSVSIYEDVSTVSSKINLHNYPNPFNPVTSIQFNLEKMHDNIRLEIYNLKGQKVKVLNLPKQQSNYYNISWDGTDQSNEAVSSGIYLYRLTSKQTIMGQAKMILLK